MRAAWRVGFPSIARGAFVVLVQAAVFVPVSLVRALDPDEGWYAYAAERVMHGELPYRDFFFPQTPLLPYVYGPWFELFGPSWYSGRALSVVFAIGTGILVYRYLAVRFGYWIALASVSGYGFSVFVIDWYLLVKTYSLTAFLVFAAVFVVDRVGRPPSPLAWLGAGVLLGLAVDARLLMILPAFGFLIPLLRSSEPKRWKVRSLGYGGAGVAIGLLPAAFFLVRAPRPFLWDTLRYHALRSPNGFVGNFHQKLQVGERLMSLPTGEGALNPQFLLLAVAGVASAAVFLLLRHPVPFPLVLAALIAAASFMPTPSYTQYFSVTVPFLLVSVAEAVAVVGERVRRADPQLWLGLTVAGGIGVLAYVALANISLNGYAHFVRPTDIHAVQRVSALIDSRSRPGEEVLTSWPGYLLGTDAVSVPGFENQYGPVTAFATGPGGSKRYKLGSIGDVKKAIQTGRTRLVVWQNWVPKQRNPSWIPLLAHSRYRRRAKLGATLVYELRAGGH